MIVVVLVLLGLLEKLGPDNCEDWMFMIQLHLNATNSWNILEETEKRPVLLNEKSGLGRKNKLATTGLKLGIGNPESCRL